MGLRGKHVRELGNNNRIVRVRNIELHLNIETVAMLCKVTYQEAFESLCEEMMLNHIECGEAVLRTIEKLRKAV